VLKRREFHYANTVKMDMSDQFRARAAVHIKNAQATSDPQLREMFLKLAGHFTWLAARRPLADKPDRVRELMRDALDAAKSGALE
jgi:hypothetical protein